MLFIYKQLPIFDWKPCKGEEERKKGFKYYCDYCDYGTFSRMFIETHNNSEKHKKQLMRNNK